MPRTLLFAIAAAALAACTTTPPESTQTTAATAMVEPSAAYRAPAPGTKLHLRTVVPGQDEAELTQLVLVTGNDYAIYANLLPDGLGGVEDLFIEYSGLYWHDCGQPKLNAAQRAQLSGLWPLEPGNSTVLSSLGGDINEMTVTVEAARIIESGPLAGEQAFQISNRYDQVDYSTFVPARGLAARIDWGDKDSDQYDGYDELMSSELVDLADYQQFVALARSACIP